MVLALPSTRMVTVGAATAGAARASVRRPAARPAERSWRCKEPPLSTRASGLWSEGGLLAPGPTPPRLPGPFDGPVARSAHAAGFPGDSGGSAPDSHRLPCPPTLVRVILYVE